MNKKQYIIPECELVLLAPTMHLAAGSDPGVTVNPNDSGINPEDFESKGGDADTWEPWED